MWIARERVDQRVGSFAFSKDGHQKPKSVSNNTFFPSSFIALDNSSRITILYYKRQSCYHLIIDNVHIIYKWRTIIEQFSKFLSAARINLFFFIKNEEAIYFIYFIYFIYTSDWSLNSWPLFLRQGHHALIPFE